MQKDPYREFIKVVPQNIMYDRRVVRGNTFAALVIPVSKRHTTRLTVMCADMQPNENRAVSQQMKRRRRPLSKLNDENSNNLNRVSLNRI